MTLLLSTRYLSDVAEKQQLLISSIISAANDCEESRFCYFTYCINYILFPDPMKLYILPCCYSETWSSIRMCIRRAYCAHISHSVKYIPLFKCYWSSTGYAYSNMYIQSFSFPVFALLNSR